MFSPMSSGPDEWPTVSKAVSSSSSASKHPTILDISQQMSRSALPSIHQQPRPPKTTSGNQKIGHFLAWKGKGKQKDTTLGAITLGQGAAKVSGKGKGSYATGATSLEAVGWNQQQGGLFTETDPLLPSVGDGSIIVGGGRRGGFKQNRQLWPSSSLVTDLAPRKAHFDKVTHSSSVENLLVHSVSGQFLSSRSMIEAARRRRWYMDFFRPTAQRVEELVDSWFSRHGILVLFPSLIVWFWCAVPFPRSNPHSINRPWCDVSPEAPWCRDRLDDSPANQSSGSGSRHDDIDANFWFFLLFYYGIYAAVALMYITQLFSLYRLNWWPSALGAKTSYTIFWLLSITSGYILHRLDFDTLTVAPRRPVEKLRVAHDVSATCHLTQTLTELTGRVVGRTYRLIPSTLHTLYQVALGASSISFGTTSNGPADDDEDDDDNIQWQRKTLWVGLAFATMAMPALICLIGLRRSGRQTYRHSLTDMQKTFLERQLARRIPASYIRFLWFVATIGLSLVALVAGQGYASVYLSTLPHTGFDGTAYVTFWMITVNLLSLMSGWILEEKVRSRALLFANKYYYFLVYFIFYRNLFARLRSFDQFAIVQLFSSFWVCIFYPLSMTSLAHRLSQHFNPRPKSWEEYVESIGLAMYLRNLAQNTTMVAFLGWVSILHFGRNQSLYPFFAFADRGDPYNYQLTMLGSGAIWASELITSFLARAICKAALGVDVTNLGLDEFREFPELLATCTWTSVHVLMDMLLFLIKLNFR